MFWRADGRHQPAIRPHRHPLAPGCCDPEGRADHQPARAAEIDPRDAAGPARGAGHLRGRALLHRFDRRPVHRNARSRGEGLPAEVGGAQEMNFPIHFLWPEALWLAPAPPLLAAVFFSRRPKAVPGMARAGRRPKHLPPALHFSALAIPPLAVARPPALITPPPHQRTTLPSID